MRVSADHPRPNRVTHELPSTSADWQLPPGWSWGAEGVWTEHRHFQEIVDALDRSLSLVSAPDPAHHAWLEAEARDWRIAITRGADDVPLLDVVSESRRGPGYLRRWIAGETIGARVRARWGRRRSRRAARGARARARRCRICTTPARRTARCPRRRSWTTPMGRLWLLGWQWAVPACDLPTGSPPTARMPMPPEWGDVGGRRRRPAISGSSRRCASTRSPVSRRRRTTSAAVALVRPDVPPSVAQVIDKALHPRSGERIAPSSPR